jgi:hypothetical protein
MSISVRFYQELQNSILCALEEGLAGPQDIRDTVEEALEHFADYEIERAKAK